MTSGASQQQQGIGGGVLLMGVCSSNTHSNRTSSSRAAHPGSFRSSRSTPSWLNGCWSTNMGV